MISVLLLRGVNVGGHGKLPMATFKDALLAAGAVEPETYIQSGNAVFEGRVSLPEVQKEISARAGFTPNGFLVASDAFQAIVRGNPYPEAADDPKSLHVFFADRPIDIDVSGQTGIDERATIGNGALYLHTPGGLSKSKLAPRIDRLFGARVTGRNWRTVLRLSEMVEARQ